MASSTEMAPLRKNLERTDMLTRLDPHIFSVNQARRSKQAPDVFLLAAAQTGFDTVDCIVIRDGIAGVTAAKRAGMKAIGFVRGGHAYATLAAQLSDAGSARVCRSMAEIGDLLTVHERLICGR